jgi:nitrogen fixation protein FixH
LQHRQPKEQIMNATKHDEAYRRGRFGAHLLWPAFIVGLLLLSIGSSAAVMMASRMDGGAQVVGDYYGKAVAWDSVADVRQQSLALGWAVEVAWGGGPAAGEREVLFTIRDRSQQPVEGLEGVIRLSRPQWATPVGEKPLLATAEPGVYRQAFALGDAGLWDFELGVRQGAVRFWKTVRKEVR